MHTRPSEKKLIAALGIAAGAGVALALSYQGMNKKGRVLQAVRAQPERVRTSVVGTRNSLAVSRVSSEATPAVVSRPAVAPAAPELRRELDGVVRVAELLAIRQTALEHVIPPAPVLLSRSQRLGAAGLDVAIICSACCIFVAISRGFHESVPMDQFEASILACSVALITAFYEFLFKIGGRRTAGQTWLTSRGNGIDQFAPSPWVPRLTVSRKYARSPLS